MGKGMHLEFYVRFESFDNGQLLSSAEKIPKLGMARFSRDDFRNFGTSIELMKTGVS